LAVNVSRLWGLGEILLLLLSQFFTGVLDQVACSYFNVNPYFRVRCKYLH